jgi:hypothetical protein
MKWVVRSMTDWGTSVPPAFSMNTQPLASAGKWRRQKSTSRRVSAVIQVPPLKPWQIIPVRLALR